MISRKRHIAKSISWRVLGTTDTLLLSWLISGNFTVGLSIGLFELFSKMILYYFHERFWYNSNLKDSNKRHIIKTFTWRIIGTFDTIIISWLISGNVYTGFKIGFAEVITKMILYFCHEKLWYRIKYGVNLKNN